MKLTIGAADAANEQRTEMRHILISLALLPALLFPALLASAAVRQATLYKNPACGCCSDYAVYLRQNGYEVTVIDTGDLPAIKQLHGVSAELEGCHSTLVDGYVVEGHVPVAAIGKLMSERPAIRGISLPGMPDGSPGMGGTKQAPFVIYEISDGAPRSFATE